MQRLRAHPLSRLEKTTDGWMLARAGDRIGFLVEPLTAAVLVRAASDVSRETLTEALSGYGSARVGAIIDALIKSGFLTQADELAELFQELSEWAAAGWEASAGYHFQTYGYPFEHYELDGTSAEDAKRMRRYATLQADTDRAKSYRAAALETITLPSPGSAASRTNSTGRLDQHALLELLSLLACPVGRTPLPWPGAEAVMLKTSPSGGGRHPTEIYARISGVAGITDGWWHAAAANGVVERIATLDNGEAKDRSPRVDLLYATVFARNRYRYREPRTFRTVHMDVGHLLGSCEYLAATRSLVATPLLNIDVAGYCHVLDLDPLIECPMAVTKLRESGPE